MRTDDRLTPQERKHLLQYARRRRVEIVSRPIDDDMATVAQLLPHLLRVSNGRPSIQRLIPQNENGCIAPQAGVGTNVAGDCAGSRLPSGGDGGGHGLRGGD